MRILEILIAAVLLASLVAPLIPVIRNQGFVKVLPLGAALLIPVQIVVEGYRWQMVPLYGIAIACAVISMLTAYRRSDNRYFIRNRLLRFSLNTLLFLIFILALFFPVMLPVVDLPAPGGPYPVGKRSYRLVDTERKELYTADPEDTRNVLITCWYPAGQTAGISRETYWDREGVTGRGYSLNADIGTFWYTHLSLVKTNSYHEARPSGDRRAFPVIVYSHSFYGLNTENTMLFEELASHGYIIVSIAHTYENVVTLFPDGEVITGNLDHLSQLYDSNADKEQQLYDEYRLASTLEEKSSLIGQILRVDDLSTRMLKIRTEDARFVLDQLEILNQSEGPLRSKFDLDRVGIMGWSFGGATSMEASLADRRFRAAVNLDGTPYGELFNTGRHLEQPLMLIRSQNDDEMEEIIGNLMMERVNGQGYLLMVENARHANFWDFPLFFKIYKRFGYWGPMDPLRLLDIEKVYIRGFFDRYLKEETDDSLEISAGKFPEVTFRKKSGS